MSTKKVAFTSKRPSQSVVPVANNIDHWVEHREPVPPPTEEEPKEDTKRLTIDVSVNLHRRIKSQCALKNLHMADEIRELLERHFGEQGAGEGASS